MCAPVAGPCHGQARAVARTPDDRPARYPAANRVARVTHVSVAPDEVTVRGEAPNDGECYLVETPIWRDAADVDQPIWREDSPVVGAFEVTLPRRVQRSDAQRDRLLSRWALASKNEQGWRLASTTRYADEVIPTARPPRPPLRSKKGLGGFDVARWHVEDLGDLGVATVTVNVVLSFLHAEPGEGREPYEYCGATYYVDEAAIGRYDQTLRAAAQRDLLVFAILLVPPPRADSATSLAMAHPEYDPEGVFPMPNVTSREGVRTYAAALDYLAARYSQAGAPHGRIHHWIVHNEVDAGWVWTNAGRKSAREYMDLYHKSMRMAHLIARQHDPQAKAFISLTHAWTEAEDPRHYPARRMLELLNASCDAQGDFDWGVAFHPYPQSLFEPATWNDDRATNSPDTPFVTFKNIDVLAEWARRTRNRFQGERVRDVYLTEQGFNSKDYTPGQLQLQAAAMAYAWKKIAQLPEIRAMHYHNWIDNRGEGGLRIGLRRFPDDAEDPGGAKPIWDVYKALGTPREDEACRFAPPILGVDDWSGIEAGEH